MGLSLRDIWHENTKVAENYVFMTLLQLLNVCFYLLIYPFLIRTLGAESYGIYAFAWSVVSIAMVVVNFGFDLPGARRVAQILKDEQETDRQKERLGEVLSGIQTAKTGIGIAIAALYAVLVLSVPFMRQNSLVFAIGFIQTLSCILLPQWYFQGRQNMRIVTYVQFAGKLASLPFIFLFIRRPEDVWLFMLISTAAVVISSCAAWLHIRFRDGIRMHLIRPRDVTPYYRQAFPFFLTNAMGVIKEQGVILLTGAFLGMTDVAIYDLANKIVTVPRILLLKVNDALYPKMVVEATAPQVKHIMRMEWITGLLVIVLIAAAGKWLVLLLGGAAMADAYPVSIILSTTVLFWMIGTAFIHFVFIPSGHSYLVTANQTVALVSCLAIVTTWLLIRPAVYGVAAGIALSGLCEVIYCSIVTRRKGLLRS